METFIKQRPIVENSSDLSGTATSDKMGDVDVDDASVCIARFENGAIEQSSRIKQWVSISEILQQSKLSAGV